MMIKKKKISIYMIADDLARIRIATKELGISLSEFIRKSVDEMLKSYDRMKL